MDSMEFWSMSSRLPVKMTPFTTSSGAELVELMERRPRTRMLALPPTLADSAPITTPERRPRIMSATLLRPRLATGASPSVFMTSTEPVKFFARVVP